MNDTTPSRPSASRGTRILLWVLAVLIMAAAYIYQRRTGPTYHLKGAVTVAGEELRYRLVRSEETVRDARVALPAPPASASGTLVYRRFKADDDWTRKPMTVMRDEGSEDSLLAADLPAQPAAGKLEYHIEIQDGTTLHRIPQSAEEEILIRFKDPVPLGVLLPHILFMFFSILIGVRAGLAALFNTGEMRGLSWITLVGMTAGGMVMGPFVQKYAFGEYWAGFPWGYDLTDNKMLIMWLVWILACGALGVRARPREGLGRAMVLFATVIMVAVYLIPHSMRGSELDYKKVDQGMDPAEAIRTGK